MPDSSDNYQLPSWPATTINRDLWNAVMGSIGARLTAREGLEASFEALIAQGTQASLDYIQATVAPQVASLQTAIELAQVQIDQIVVDGVSPNSQKLGGQLPAYYATATALTDGLATKVPTSRTVAGKALTADVTLGKADVGLGSVDNTSDADKPISTAQAEALAKRVSVDAAQSFTPAEQGQARANVGCGILAGHRNKILNGDFAINLRGVTSVAAGATAFAADRWIVSNNTNQPVGVSVQPPTPGQIDVPGEPATWLILNFATAPSSGTLTLTQRIESVRTLAGKKSTMTFYSTGPASGAALSAAVSQNFGAGGSPSSTVTTNAVLNIGDVYSSTGRKRQAVVDLPSIAGKTIGTTHDGYLSYAITITPRAAGNYVISHASLVEGDATAEDDPFAGRDRQLERLLCERYCREVDIGMRGYGNQGSNFSVKHALSPPMRSTPTATVIASNNFDTVFALSAGSIEVGLNAPTGNGAVYMLYRGRLDAEFP